MLLEQVFERNAIRQENKENLERFTAASRPASPPRPLGDRSGTGRGSCSRNQAINAARGGALVRSTSSSMRRNTLRLKPPRLRGRTRRKCRARMRRGDPNHPGPASRICSIGISETVAQRTSVSASRSTPFGETLWVNQVQPGQSCPVLRPRTDRAGAVIASPNPCGSSRARCPRTWVSPKSLINSIVPQSGCSANARINGAACHHDDLGFFAGLADQPGQGRELQMQAGLRLVQHHQLGRPRRQAATNEGSAVFRPTARPRPADGADRGRQCRRLNRPSSARMASSEPGKASAIVAAIPDRLQCRGRIPAVALGSGCRSGSAAPVPRGPCGSDRRTARTAPVPGPRAPGRPQRVDHFGEHGFVRSQLGLDRCPAPAVPQLDQRSPPFDQQGGRPHHLPAPDHLPLDLRIEVEVRAPGMGMPRSIEVRTRRRRSRVAG